MREVEAAKWHKLKKVEEVQEARSGTICNQSKVVRGVPRSPIVLRVRDGSHGLWGQRVIHYSNRTRMVGKVASWKSAQYPNIV